MTKRQRAWARNNGFVYSRKLGWTHPSGLRIVWSGGWAVMTPGCGFHPSIRVPS